MAIKRHATKYNLLQKLSEADRKIKHPEMILGTSGTTFGPMMSPQRVPMYVKHFVQHMTLEHPTFPRVFTGTENLYGDISTYYVKPTDRLQVMRVVKKFPTDHVSSVFVKNLETGEYDVIERADAKSLTEVFGFSFNNEVLDQLEENEVIEPDTILSRSTGYDEYNNHCIGTNAMALFSFHPNLTEDAALISQSFVERATFTKIHSIEIRIPPKNMIPLNVHGDSEHYKALPDVGDEIEDVVCALRNISITQMAELTNERLMQVNRLQDMVYTCKGEVIDIDIFVNGDVPDSPVYDQIRTYIEYQRKYYKAIYEFCQSIKREPRTTRLKTLYDRAIDFVNEDGMWIEKNIIKTININITIKERVYMTPGQKITGYQYGWCKIVKCWNISA